VVGATVAKVHSAVGMADSNLGRGDNTLVATCLAHQAEVGKVAVGNGAAGKCGTGRVDDCQSEEFFSAQM
jgi:hypothetical protein